MDKLTRGEFFAQLSAAAKELRKNGIYEPSFSDMRQAFFKQFGSVAEKNIISCLNNSNKFQFICYEAVLAALAREQSMPDVLTTFELAWEHYDKVM